MTDYALLTVGIGAETVSAFYSRPPGINDTATGDLNRTPRLLETLDVLTRQLLENRLTDRNEFELLGACLYDHLFTGKVAQRLESWLADLPTGRVLRIVLQFDESDSGDEVARPWEYLRIPAGRRQGFVATKEELVLSRQIRFATESRATTREPAAEQLRILVGIASPPKERLPRWGQGSQRGVGDLPNVSEVAEDLVGQLERSGADVVVDRALTLPGLITHLAASGFQPHVVHLVLHGDYEEGRGGGLALCDPTEQRLAAWTRDADLADAVAHVPSVVFLHACSGARTDQVRGFRGVAMRLVERGVPAVVAMNFEIEAGVATSFAIRFYEELARGTPIDRAVQLGRKRIGTAAGAAGNFSDRAFGCPVAFVQVPGAVILPSELIAAPVAPVARTGVTSCPRCTNPMAAAMRRCLNCGARVAPCPNPDCGRLWVPEVGFCPWCEYEPPAAGAGPAEPAVAATAPAAMAPAAAPPVAAGTPAAGSARAGQAVPGTQEFSSVPPRPPGSDFDHG